MCKHNLNWSIEKSSLLGPLVISKIMPRVKKEKKRNWALWKAIYLFFSS